MNTIWSEIEAIFQAKNCLSWFELNPGASQEEIRALEEHLGVALPPTLKELLAIHNGQNAGFGMFFGLQFLSTSGIKEQWDMWVSLENDGLNEELADMMSSKPEGYIKPLYLNRQWIPLTHDSGGNHIGIDYDPDVKGILGQMIIFGRDDDEKKLKAASFDAFMRRFIEELKTVQWEVTEDGWKFFDKEHRIHYHDWARS